MPQVKPEKRENNSSLLNIEASHSSPFNIQESIDRLSKVGDDYGAKTIQMDQFKIQISQSKELNLNSGEGSLIEEISGH